MPTFEVTETGFPTPRLPEARTRIVELWRGAFGENADTSSDNPDGKIIDILSLLLALTWQGVGVGASSGHARTAVGNALDLVLDLFARRRLEALASTTDLFFYGTDSTLVLASSLVAVQDTSNTFGTNANANIGADDSVWIVRVDAAANATNYTVTVNAVAATYLSDGSADVDEIRTGVLAALNAHADVVDAWAAGEDANGLLLIAMQTTPAIAVSITSGAMTRYHSVRVPSTATTTGPIQGLTGTVRTLITPIAGVVGITSIADATVGRNRETNAQFFARHLRTLSANGARSPDAVAARLVELDDVEVARVYENETALDPDAAGRPAHSFETYVLGGDDAEIAALIWQQKPGGIRAFGSTVVQTIGRDDRLHPVGFTRPTERYLHLEITVTGGEGYPLTGTPLVSMRNAVASDLGDGGAHELALGQDFYRFAVGPPASAAVPGIASLSIRTATTAAPGDPPTFALADIVVAESEILRIDSSRITMIQV
jgi:hypothetical protein